MRTLSDEDRDIVEQYFSNAILEMQEGLPKYILEDILEHYEEQELYLACAGIKKALDWYQTNTFTKVLLKIEEIKENNKLN
jgi:hypothetical protein